MTQNHIADLWLAAVESRGRDARVTSLTATALIVRRYGFGQHRGKVVQQLQGWTAIASWLATAPAAYTFSLAQPADPTVSVSAVRYVVRGPDGFVGGGVWHFQADTSGQLTAIDHQPDDLPDPAWPDELAQVPECYGLQG